MDARNITFQRLKPSCVALSQAALYFASGRNTAKDVTRALEELHLTLDRTIRDGCVFDGKLADYTFFPLSHVLRESQKLPKRALELALLCLTILIQHGWKSNMELGLAKQLLILLSFLAGGNPSVTKTDLPSEEMQRAAFDCLGSLFQALGKSASGKRLITDTEMVPALGHTVTVLLEGAEGGTSVDVQLSALNALDSLEMCISDREALANFFPGIVSSVTKVLNPTTQMRRHYKVLQNSLDILSRILLAVVGDVHNRTIIAQMNSPEAVHATGNQKSQLTASWLKATAAQVKMALSNVIRLRNHERAEVRDSLRNLCLTVIEQCRKSLSESASMMMETLVTLAGKQDETDASTTAVAVKHVASADASVKDMMRSSLHSWAITLPRIMSSNDDNAKRRVIGQISTTFRILSELGTESSIVDNTLASNLRDSISAAIHISPTVAASAADVSAPSVSLVSTESLQRNKIFQPVLMGQRGQRETLTELQSLVSQISTSESALTIAEDMLNHMYSSSGDELLSSFWLSLEILRNSASGGLALEDFIDFGPSSSVNSRTSLIEELYSYSLSCLTDTSVENEPDWRLQALAVESVALQAGQMKKEFRVELVDALYPLVHLIGSSNSALREHAIACLDMVAEACEYHDASDLLISNVDYLVNAIALKLNTFDISPQAPRVLLMMIKLSGPSLIPYLDDLVDSIFAALDCFHGYPKLVELLFNVLIAIVEEGSKSDILTIESGIELDQALGSVRKHWRPRSITEVATQLREAKAKRLQTGTSNLADDVDDTLPDKLPRRPWKDLSERPAVEEITSDDDDDDEDDLEKLLKQYPSEPEPPSSPSTLATADASSSKQEPSPQAAAAARRADKTISLLTSITRLTQHYLTQPGSTFRASLLHLISISSKALAKASAIAAANPPPSDADNADTQQDIFLPLINDIWPPLIKRLFDKEPFVTEAAAKAITQLCETAGDFLAGRIVDEWANIAKLCRRFAPDMPTSISISSSSSSSSSPSSSLSSSLSIPNSESSTFSPPLRSPSTNVHSSSITTPDPIVAPQPQPQPLQSPAQQATNNSKSINPMPTQPAQPTQPTQTSTILTIRPKPSPVSKRPQHSSAAAAAQRRAEKANNTRVWKALRSLLLRIVDRVHPAEEVCEEILDLLTPDLLLSLSVSFSGSGSGSGSVSVSATDPTQTQTRTTGQTRAPGQRAADYDDQDEKTVREQVRSVLERWNPDAVWLQLESYTNGKFSGVAVAVAEEKEKKQGPVLDAVTFRPLVF
ncbi:hypothetical protein L228DRAFT_261701 [Xylona heveae TC161]|uniref:ARM repeat-containing protein n=1 Tax=Xylona heveae (strain CBS 132557 / TC161) TaxID=1328760 RepID=A0A165FYN8_XYLHT|nr:hypothetical protein L228DRAFT_261701 [Xylona heveae TC161]KZF21540.1 hypothetical protein L228DRAFT_261701 [Xylona heveae TC161]